MKTTASVFAVALTLYGGTVASAQVQATVPPKTDRTIQHSAAVTVTRADGGSIRTPLGSSGLAVNRGSSLTREWIAIHDSRLPLDLDGTPGVSTVYESSRLSGDYKYDAKLKVSAYESLRAIEIRFLVFDVWGNHVHSLSMTEVEDIQGTKDFHGQWNVYSENEVSEHYASIAYVARVRTADGRVAEADPSVIVAEARKLSKKFTASDLEPKPLAPPGR